MKTFAKLLNEYLQEMGIKPDTLPERLGCDAAKLHASLQGEQKLEEDIFLQIIRSLPFSLEQNKYLRYSYYADEFTRGEMDRLNRFGKWLADGTPQDVICPLPAPRPLPERSMGVEGMQEILAYLVSMFMDSSCRTVTTNYPFCYKEIDDAVYSLLRSKPEIKLQHIIAFDESNKSTNNIDNLFCSLRYIKCGHNPLCFNVPFLKEEDAHSLYPYFFLSENYIFFLSLEHSVGLFVANPEIHTHSQGLVARIVQNCEPLAIIPENVLSLKSIVADISRDGTCTTIGNTLCVCLCATESVFEHMARPDLPDRPVLVQMAINHYRALNKTTSIKYCQRASIEAFAKTGVIHEFPRHWTTPLSYEDRRIVLRKMKEIALGDSPSLFILEDNIVRNPDPFLDLELFSTSAMLLSGGIGDIEQAYAGEFLILLRNPGIIADLKNYLQFIRRHKIFCSQDYVRVFFDDLLLECERLQGENDHKSETKKLLHLTVDRVRTAVPLDSILYIETVGRKREIITDTTSFPTYQNSTEIEGQLDERFVRCHRSFLVNLAQVESLEKNSLRLRNGTLIDVSRTYLADIREQYARISKKK